MAIEKMQDIPQHESFGEKVERLFHDNDFMHALILFGVAATLLMTSYMFYIFVQVINIVQTIKP
jgi:hypothetical protein